MFHMNNFSLEVAHRSSFIPNLAYSGRTFYNEFSILLNDFDVDHLQSVQELRRHLGNCSIVTSPEVIIMEIDEEGDIFQLVTEIRANPLTSGAIVILLAEVHNSGLKSKALKEKVSDFYIYPFSVEEISERLKFLIKFKLIKPDVKKLVSNTVKEYRIPFGKRLFDIFFASMAILLLSPLFIIIAILIKLESRGPIIYKSKRAGTGYKIFDFYKLRSMVVDADKKLKELSQVSNQYAMDDRDQAEPSAFIKIKNDPRVTRVGNFIRNTSIDELPQLFNVLKGDMSIVGNRPLPLYEAELLTSNLWAMRFLGPAGITGLWQVSKRGKSKMSDEERKELDNFYAKNSSFLMDMNIILKTIPALLQKEDV